MSKYHRMVIEIKVKDIVVDKLTVMCKAHIKMSEEFIRNELLTMAIVNLSERFKNRKNINWLDILKDCEIESTEDIDKAFWWI